MKTNGTKATWLLLAGLCLPRLSMANLAATDLSWGTGSANLTSSRISVQMGAQWMDVEEEAEIQVTPLRSSGSKQWIVEGTFVVPKGTALTGCMLWNDDTLLIGKLRGKSEANAIFDSLVPPRQPAWARDPLLIEQLNDTTYGLHLFPFAANGSRRFRLRYLVPLQPGSKSMSIKPLMAKSVNGSLPPRFRLKVKGDVVGAKLQQAKMTWPLELPFSDLIELNASDDVTLSWPSGPADDATRAIRSRIDTGAWKGDFVLYTSRIPDSILSKIAIRSETVVLWKWLHPNHFVGNCYTTNGTYSPCNTWYGNIAVKQAEKIRDLALYLTSFGNKVGLLADLSLGDTTIRFPASSSGSATYRQMDLWLAGINAEYLKANIPVLPSGFGNEAPSALDISRDRRRFKVDVLDAGMLFSKDSGIVRHLLVVTIGEQSSNAYLEPFDTTLLPKGLSVASSDLLPSTRWDSKTRQDVAIPPAAAQWPGVDLAGLVQARKGLSIAPWNGIDLPEQKTSYAGRLSFQSGSGKISRNLVVRKAPNGGLIASLNVHGANVAKSVNWALFNDDGSTLRTWDVTPDWLESPNDSVVPRLWAKSEAPLSPIFQEKELAPLFGFVDPFYSLLATPSDTVGHDRQALLVDSGVPFLTSREIFARVGYGSDRTGIEDAATRFAKSLRVRLDGSSRLLRIDLEGVSATRIEIRDLQGRLLAAWDKTELAGRKSLEWRLPGGIRGMLLVNAQTATGLRSARVLAH